MGGQANGGGGTTSGSTSPGRAIALSKTGSANCGSTSPTPVWPHSTASFSLAHCSSSVRMFALFRRGEALCGDSASMIQRHEFAGFLQPPLDVVLLLQRSPVFEVMTPTTTTVSSANSGSGSKPPARSNHIREIAVRNWCGPAWSPPPARSRPTRSGGAEIAAADMRRDRHVGRPLGDRVVITRRRFPAGHRIVARGAGFFQLHPASKDSPHGVIELQ